ncbi:MAG: hypothetical protein UW70_C0008G0006 [Candidatus Peregrinibacteria bacterium GW2011_GWA2_44_7]|nr:MAG: hypothetical protein UW70_C0008G0006 [Candidatus Peregrinibacteria bacterium GW2011_GWA2_44_7]
MLVSTGLMFTFIYSTAINPSVLTNILSAQENTSNEASEENESTSIEEGAAPEETGSQSYQTKIEKGDALFKEGYYELAAQQYEQASVIETDLSEPFNKLGAAYFENEDYEKALDAFTESLKKNSTQAIAQIGLGRSLLALEKFDAATQHFAQLTMNDPGIVYYQGVMSAYNGDYEKAKLNFTQLIPEKNTAKIGSEWPGKAQNYLNSMEEYVGAQDPNPNYIKTLMARSFVETGEKTLAINTLYKVLQQESDYRDAWIILGYTYLNEEQWNEAQDALFKAVEIDPTKAETRYFLGLTYYAKEDYTSTIAQMELALQSGFKPVLDPYTKIGDSAVHVQDYQKAIEAYEKILVLDSGEVDLFIRPVWIYIDHLNNPKKAIEWAERAVTEHPNEAMGYNLLGWAQMANGELEEAEQNLNYALVLDSKLAAAYLNFGTLYEKEGKLEQAKENYKRAYTLDPSGSAGNRAAENYNRLQNTTTESQNTVTPSDKTTPTL